MRSFHELFRGSETGHGTYGDIRGAQPTDRGKLNSSARTVHSPATQEQFELHLAGKKRLGIPPVMKNLKVYWFCIDVDHYDDKDMHAKLAAAIIKCGLPLVITRTKSGGAHLWCFLEEPILAGKALEIAQAYGSRLELPADHIDFFPKTGEKNDNFWVNLPYFGDACKATGEDGLGNLSLEDFLIYANDRIVDGVGLDKSKKEKTKKTKSDAPPCIDYMLENGVEEGYRDLALCQYIVYAKRKWPDEWEEKATEFNDDHITPPLRKDELRKTLKSNKAKDYNYQCKAMKAIFCDASACKKREFGVGSEEEIEVPIEAIEKIDGENPIYRISLYGKTFTCEVKQLFNIIEFRKAAFAACDRFVPAMKQCVWEDVLKEHLDQMAVTQSAVDTEMRDRVIAKFQAWCATFMQTKSLTEALLIRQPFYDGKRIVFSGDHFMTLIDRDLKAPRDRVFLYMRNWGVVLIEEEGQRLWCWPQNGPLWFDPDKDNRA